MNDSEEIPQGASGEFDFSASLRQEFEFPTYAFPAPPCNLFHHTEESIAASPMMSPPLSPSPLRTYQRQQQQNQNNSQLLTNTRALLPTNLLVEENKGRYNFTHNLKLGKKKTATQMVFSTILNKLFIQKDTYVSIDFHADIPLVSPNVEIRAAMCFTEVKHHNNAVETCPNHQEQWKDSSVEKHSVILTPESSSCSYFKCPVTGRCLIRVQPDPSLENQFKFQCLSTCVGGINRRNVAVLFLLYANGKYEGQSMLDLSITRSPARACKIAERNNIKQNEEPKDEKAKPIPCIRMPDIMSDKQLDELPMMHGYFVIKCDDFATAELVYRHSKVECYPPCREKDLISQCKTIPLEIFSSTLSSDDGGVKRDNSLAIRTSVIKRNNQGLNRSVSDPGFLRKYPKVPKRSYLKKFTPLQKAKNN